MQTCTLVLRRYTPGGGITETSLPIASLSELYEYCVTRAKPHDVLQKESQLVARFEIAGADAQGRQRRLTFAFQSVTV